MRFEAVIYDFDGTVIDTESVIYRAWQNTFAGYGAAYNIQDYQECIGGSDEGKEPLLLLQRQVADALDSAQVDYRFRSHLKVIDDEPLRDGVLNSFEICRSSEIKMAIGSSSSRRWVSHLCELHGIDSYFGTLVTKDDVERVKPDPAIFLLAAKLLGVDPARCLVIEDSVKGVAAAKSAGMHCLAVPGPMTAHMDFGQADFLLETLLDFSNILEI